MFFFFAAALAWAGPEEIIDPRPSGGWIVDQADILDEEMEARLNERITALEQDTTVEILIVTIEDTEMVPKEYATALFNRLTIGKATSNNGLLVLMVMGQRRLEMETGYGMETVLGDAWLGVMQARAMVPQFREGNFGAGIEAGIAECDAEIRDNALEARLGTQLQDIEYPGWPSPEPHVYTYIPMTNDRVNLLSYGGMGAIGLMGMMAFRRRRRRTCPDCKIYMPKVPEAREDEYLDAGQEKEEAIGSVRWSVHCCMICDTVRTFSWNTSWHGYKRCSKCKYRTCKSERETITYPTQTSTGLARVTSNCEHCGLRHSRTVTLAKLPKPSPSSSSSSSSSSSYSSSSYSSSSSSRSYSSSSSSSSSRSYGGGRSRGGGAGSSW